MQVIMNEFNEQILRLREVESVTGLSRASIYGRISINSKYYDETFPKPIKLGSGRAIGFILSEVEGWIDFRRSERNK